MKHQFNGIVVNVHETHDARQWYMTIEEVAKGYGVAESTIKTHLRDHADEIRSGIERGEVGITDSIGRRQMSVALYREGVIKLDGSTRWT